MNLLKDINDNQLDESISRFKMGDVIKLKPSAISALNKIEPGKFSKADLNLTFKIEDTPIGDKKGIGYRWRWRIILSKPLKDEYHWDEKYFELSTVNESEIIEAQADGQAPKIDLTLLAKVNDESAPKTDQNDVHDILDKAKDESEEVETITFGLETDDDEIVKVYVNATDADGFEEAMSKMLGSEDSIEDALEKLSVDFDIVAVEWPDDEEESEEDEELNFDDSEAETDTMNDLEFSDKSEEEVKTTEGEQDMSIGNRFLQRILGEEIELTEKKKVEDEEVNAKDEEESKDLAPLLKRFKFTAPMSKMILDTLIAINVPVMTITRNFSNVRNGIIDSARAVQKNARAKMWLTRFLRGANSMSELKEGMDIKSEVSNIGIKKVAGQLFDVVNALGVPEDNFTFNKAELRKFFRDTSIAINKDSRMRMILKNLHTSLGLSDDSEGNKHNLDAPASEIAEEVDLTADVLLSDISSLMAALGIPDENLNYKKMSVVKALKEKKKSLQNINLIRNRMKALIKLVNDNTKEAVTEAEDTEDEDVEKAEKQKRGKKAKLNPLDAGKWDVASLGNSGIMMKAKSMSIKLPETEVEKLVAAFGDNKIVMVKGQAGKKFSFRPYRMGNDNVYIVKQAEDDKYPDGIILPQASIDVIMDTLASQS